MAYTRAGTGRKPESVDVYTGDFVWGATVAGALGMEMDSSEAGLCSVMDVPTERVPSFVWQNREIFSLRCSKTGEHYRW